MTSPLRATLVCLVLASTASMTHPSASATERRGKIPLESAYGKMPLAFETNEGQTDPAVRFLARGRGYTVFLTPTEAVLTLRAPSRAARAPRSAPAGAPVGAESQRTGAVMRMKLAAANGHPTMEPERALEGRVNYLIGRDETKWHTDIPSFARVRTREVYPGVDLIYYGDQGQLEYDFIVAPNADDARIRMEVGGANDLSVDRSGDLVVALDGRDLRWHRPVAYQQ